MVGHAGSNPDMNPSQLDERSPAAPEPIKMQCPSGEATAQVPEFSWDKNKLAAKDEACVPAPKRMRDYAVPAAFVIFSSIGMIGWLWFLVYLFSLVIGALS